VRSSGPGDPMSMYAAAWVLFASVQVTDTVVDVARGDRLVIEQITGRVQVVGWDRDAVEVRAAEGGPSLGIRWAAGEVRVVRTEGRGRLRAVDATVRVPRWIALEIGSPSLDVSVSGTSGDVRIANVSGDVWVTDVQGALDVRSIRGEIVVTDARGGVRATSQADDVTLTRVAGTIDVRTLNGDITLEDARSLSVRIEALHGDVFFSGALEPGGEYGIYVHDGDATLVVPASVSARVSVSTFDGDFESDFPVRVERLSAGRPLEFVLGGGAASLRLEVFDGKIRLLQRPQGGGAR
jgi:hypothetical protein